MGLLKRLLLLLSLVTSSSALLGIIGRTQSVAVQGKLTCNGEPAKNVRVKLYEKEALLDVKLDEGKTNQNGEFSLSGSKTEISNIDPKVNIYHRCNYDGPCWRKVGINIPSNFITDGATPEKKFDIGTINLASRFSNELPDCIN
ncbi:TransThyretin family domain [Trichostrongylus colubriformis]|uniref:TransThyretin family domain n=1 Tax=Trichostrongylus colubriformis TaxID=6319 RepID=A0AAN8IKN0_TRICO